MFDDAMEGKVATAIRRCLELSRAIVAADPEAEPPLPAMIGRALELLPVLEGEYALSSESSQAQLNHFNLGLGVWRSMESGASPHEAASLLREAVSSSDAAGICVMPIWGAAPQDSTELGCQTRLMSLSELPPSRCLQELQVPSAVPWPSTAIASLRDDPPKFALVRKKTISPAFHLREEGSGAGTMPSKEQSLFDDIRRILCLTVCAPVISAKYWFQFDNPIWRHGVGSVYQMQTPEIPPLVRIEDRVVDCGKVREVVASFDRLSESRKSEMRIAMDRFAMSVSRFDVGNSCVEIGIALESLVCPETDRISSSTAVRVARLLRVDVDERVAVRELIKGLYNLRSQCVHTGKCRAEIKIKGRGRVQSYAVLREVRVLVAELILELIARGPSPDWVRLELE